MNNIKVRLNKNALLSNVAEFARICSGYGKIMAVVKANAYGHGLEETVTILGSTPVRRFGVFTLDEAIRVRNIIPDSDVLIFQSLFNDELREAIERRFDVTVGSFDNLQNLVEITRSVRTPPSIHLKVETGTNRQGITGGEIDKVSDLLSQNKRIRLKGIYTHFANIEDTTDHSYAFLQLSNYGILVNDFSKNGINFEYRHTACSAATILFPETHLDLVRIGISLYGHWPSRETFISAGHLNIKKPNLIPVMSIVSKIIQIKSIKASDYIGYGCSYRATRDMKIGILPIGYANGYLRAFSNRSYVIAKGRRAPVVGRVCMNMTIIDITDIPGIRLFDEVILLGRDGNENISAEDLASIAGTINYEILTLVDPLAEREII